MYQRRRARLLLVLLIISSLVLVTVDFRSDDDEGLLDGLRGVVTSVLRPVQDGLIVLVRPVGDATSAVTDLFGVREENQRLQDRLAQLEERHRSDTDLERENAELRELLGLRDRTGLETISARTVALAPSNFEWTITVDAGSDDGVERDMAVINADGLVGRVIQVRPGAARVLLAIDPNFSAAARVAGNGEVGLVDGRGGDPMLFRPLDTEADIEIGDELVTSSYEGAVFPGGVPIGTVADVGDTGTRLSREVQARPFVDFTRLHQVLIVESSPVEDLPPFRAEDEEFDPPDVDPLLDPEADGNDNDDDGDGNDDGNGD